jgi:hypothetical protein
MDIRPIFFQEILFFDFLEEVAYVVIYSVLTAWEGRIEKRDSSFPE